MERSLKPEAVKKYRKALGFFLAWLAWHSVLPVEEYEFVDLLLEWKNDRHCPFKPPTRSDLETTVAATMKVLPQFKGGLLGIRGAVKSWKVVVRPDPTVRLGRPWIYGLAIRMARFYGPCCGALLLLQYLHCLRPSEALGLTTLSFLLPEETVRQTAGLLFLGLKAGTKSGRPQTVLVTHPIAIAILRWLRTILAEGSRLGGTMNLETYNRRMKKVALSFGLQDVGWTPHSPRAGFASDSIAAEMPFTTLREFGRWQHDSSLRGYLDLMLTMGGTILRDHRAFVPAFREMEENFLSLFPTG